MYLCFFIRTVAIVASLKTANYNFMHGDLVVGKSIDRLGKLIEVFGMEIIAVVGMFRGTFMSGGVNAHLGQRG